MTIKIVTAALLSLGLTASIRLFGATLRVPADHPTIKAAVRSAGDGDTVLVGDGVYLESGIVIERRITVRSEHLFGAVIYGSSERATAVFIVRAAARIEGFILRGGTTGIIQRNSPDVEWQAADLALFDFTNGLAIDDSEGSVGSARIRRVSAIGDGGVQAFVTNDARAMDVADCLAMGFLAAFAGYDHLSFRVGHSVALDCGSVVDESTAHRPIPPATSRVELDRDVRTWRSTALGEPGLRRELLSFFRGSLFPRGAGGYESTRDDAAREAMSALIMARSEKTSGELGAAAASYGIALAAAEKAGTAEFMWQALIAQADLGGPDKSIEARIARYRRAIEHLERWIAGVPAGMHRIDFLRDKARAYETLIGLLFEARAAAPSSGYGAEAFLSAERYRDLSLQYVSRNADERSREARIDDPVGQEARKRIAAIQIRLQDPSLAAGAKEELVASLEAAEEDYSAELIKEERSRRSRAMSGLEASSRAGASFNALDYGAVKARLHGRTLLSYVLGESASFAFWATEDGLECAKLPPAQKIAGLVEPYLRFLQLGDSREFRGVNAGRILFKALLGPFAERLGSYPRQIIVIPHGCLRYLPFETLVPDGESATGRWRFWGETASIGYAASAAQALAPPRSNQTAKPAERVLAVGNSGAIRCDNRFPNRKEIFLPLSHVRREIESVARAFPRGEVTVLLDDRAGEHAVKNADLGRYDIIHIAAHGVVDDICWWRSALLLGPDRNSGEDGFLTALEIAELEVRARLVVLSACGTGTGRLFVGEGIGGLSGAFLAAGAEDVVVSLWSVDDRATAELMGRFYGRLAAGAPAAEALSEAKRWMIGRGYRNPFFWAPFVLIGRAAER